MFKKMMFESVNLLKAFLGLIDVQCLFVQSKNSGVQVRSSLDEHVPVSSMFAK